MTRLLSPCFRSLFSVERKILKILLRGRSMNSIIEKSILKDRKLFVIGDEHRIILKVRCTINLTYYVYQTYCRDI